MNDKIYDVLILGGGASGLMAAISNKQKDIGILEVNSEVGAKIKISGGGRCNITNKTLSSKNYLADADFIDPSLKNFTSAHLLQFFQDRGLEFVLRKEGQYFCKESAKEVLSVLSEETRDIPIFFRQEIRDVKKENGVFKVICDRKSFYTKKLVVATGGLSYPKIGASDIAYKIAQNFGHDIVLSAPALVGFTVQKEQAWFKMLSGVSTFVQIKIGDKIFRGDLLFAHKGISGPAILNTSLYWTKGKITIDFLPDFIFSSKLQSSHKFISSFLLLPKRFIKSYLEQIGLEDKPVSKLTAPEIEKLKDLKSYTFAPAGNFGYSKAEVTKGGIATSQINKNTMESLLEKNLFFIGECLDVTGELGGYNFQWAFSSAVKLTL